MKLKLLLFSVLFLPVTTFGSVWTATHNWDESFEEKFSTFIETLPLNIFVEGQWAGTVADCTDTTYILRIIFAYENSLPVRFHTDSAVLTNETNRFDNIQDPVKRVKAFYLRIAEDTDSGSMNLDSYPVAINRNSLKPGVMDVHRPFPGQGGSGHSQYIRTIKDNGVIGFIWNSVPPAVRMLSLTFGISYVPRLDTPEAGFRRWIWPQDVSKDPAGLPYFSLEQYSMGENNSYTPPSYELTKFSQEVIKRLKIRDISPQEILETYVPGICSYVTLRGEVTARARDLKDKMGPRCLDAQQFDDLSTYSRDSRLGDMFNDLFWQFAKQPAPNARYVAPEVERAINAACPLKALDPANSMDTYDFLQYLVSNAVSSNPNDDYWVRWGYKGSRNVTCPIYN